MIQYARFLLFPLFHVGCWFNLLLSFSSSKSLILFVYVFSCFQQIYVGFSFLASIDRLLNFPDRAILGEIYQDRRSILLLPVSSFCCCCMIYFSFICLYVFIFFAMSARFSAWLDTWILDQDLEIP